MMDLDPELLQQILDVFSIELEEQLLSISNSLLQLERASSEVDRVAELESIFRAAHNIKGAARAIDVKHVADIAHHLESLFSQLKQQSGEQSSTHAIDLAFETLDVIKSCMTAYLSDKEPEIDLAQLYERLECSLEVIATQNTVTEPPSVSEVVPVAPDVVTLDGISGDAHVQQAVATSRVEEPAKLVGTALSDGILRVSAAKIDQLIASGEEMQSAHTEMGLHSVEMKQLKNEMLQLCELLQPIKFMLKTNRFTPSQKKLYGELKKVVNIGQVMKQRSECLHASMHTAMVDFGFVTAELNDNLYALRLVAATKLMQEISRLVRDTGRSLGKEVQLEVHGDEIEIDRVILDELKAPLIHLIRNSIDHGIESAAERLEEGKPADGLITICFSRSGSEIKITVSDDGRGIDRHKVADAAVKKKLITLEERHGMDAVSQLELIFKAGFSTCEMVTDVSGRGVGLDVVRERLTAIKGRVFVETTSQQGTCFHLYLPRLLSTERGLLVKVAADIYVIPSRSVDRLITVAAADIVKVDGNEAVLIDERPVLIRSLAKTLNLSIASEVEGADALMLLIIKQGASAVAFLIDDVVHEREVVIKPLMGALSKIPHVLGAAVSASLGVMVVLNSYVLLEQALRSSSDLKLKKENHKVVVKQRILLVDDSITTRTLEKSVLESKGYHTSLAVNGSQAWDILQSESFDLIISDVEMPLMNGFELAAKIKGDARLKETPVIIVTSLANDADKKRGIDAGADAYIVKSQFESRALLKLIGQLI
ncbi:MAG: response regulator [Mariprofundus sp.]|nr:response regulator [Mariprofundus sp.]